MSRETEKSRFSDVRGYTTK